MPLGEIAQAGVQVRAGGGGQVDQLLLVNDLDRRLELVGARRVAHPRVEVAVRVRRLRFDGRMQRTMEEYTWGRSETLVSYFNPNMVKHALILDD